MRFPILWLAGMFAATLGMPALACSPRIPNSLAHYLQGSRYLIEATPEVARITEVAEGLEEAEVSLTIIRFLKWPANEAAPQALTFRVAAFDDGVNCPPWYYGEGARYFVLARNPETNELRIDDVIGAFAAERRERNGSGEGEAENRTAH